MEDALRRKLLADAEGTGDDRRQSIIPKLIISWTRLDQRTPEAEADLRKIHQHIALADSCMQKTSLAHRSAEQELSHYAQLSQRISGDIEVAHQRIAECRKALSEAKQIRKHRQEYDSMATLIKQHPSRQDSAKLLDQLKNDLHKSEEKRDQSLEQLDQRRKQLHVLFVSLRELSVEERMIVKIFILLYGINN